LQASDITLNSSGDFVNPGFTQFPGYVAIFSARDTLNPALQTFKYLDKNFQPNMVLNYCDNTI